jgi:hypothetical protein
MDDLLSMEALAEAAPAQSLREALAAVPDPRQRRGLRHGWTALLGLSVSAMLCGARGQSAIAQWGADQQGPITEALGFPSSRRMPCHATFHHVFKRLDREKLEAVLAAYFAQVGLVPGEGIAIDGKSLRGAHGEDVPGVDLVAAYAHRARLVLAQKGGRGREE